MKASQASATLVDTTKDIQTILIFFFIKRNLLGTTNSTGTKI